MTFLPIVERELRVAARRRHTYWTRFFAALTTLALCTWVWLAANDAQPAHERGQLIFQFIAGLAFTYSLVAGISITADSLSEEKREGTLGLLFLTDLKGYDVVLGKLAATSLNALYRLFSVFPILAIPLLLGSLTLGEFWRMVLVLTNTLFFSLSAGMVASAISVRERQAVASTVLLILLVTAGPPLAGLGLAIREDRAHQSMSGPNQKFPYQPVWLYTSAVYPAALAFDARYKVNPQHFWSAVATTHALGWGFLAAASLLVRRSWQDRPATGPTGLQRERWREWQFGHGRAQAAFRRRLLDINPVLWLAGRDRLKQVLVWAVLAGCGLVWLWLFWKWGRSMLDPTLYVVTACVLQTILKLWLAADACRPLAEDRQTGALELVLSTPLSVDGLLLGQILALKRQFGWPAGMVLCADLIMLMAGAGDASFESANDWLFLWLALMILFVADLYTLAWVGLWLGLTSRKVNRAIRGTVGRVLILPWAVFVLGVSLLAMLQPQTFEPGEFGLLGAGFALGMLNDAIFFGWARANLRERFRLAATQRYQITVESDRTPPRPQTTLNRPEYVGNVPT